ncbi:MAG: hypothetical protein AAB405_01955 [Patescibacteria group bacterium]
MQNYNSKLKIIILFTFCLLLTTSITYAALVPCGPGTSKASCEFCDLLTLAEKVLDFALYYIAVPLVVIFIIYGGFVILTAGDKPERVSDGRKIITSAVIGLLIALLAWLLIDTILQVIAGNNLTGNWWNPAVKINCQ